MSPHILRLLTDPSWLGWTLCEVERRGWRYSVSVESGGWYRALVWIHGQMSTEPRMHASLPAALVAMLEATCP